MEIEGLCRVNYAVEMMPNGTHLILGGLGSLRGAVAGGFLLGFIEIYLAAFLPPEMQEFRDPIGLSIVVLVLLFRPNGLIPAASLKSEKV